jgi:O-acetyl-ADP-ribose deacetylase (regulator of RNase III)
MLSSLSLFNDPQDWSEPAPKSPPRFPLALPEGFVLPLDPNVPYNDPRKETMDALDGVNAADFAAFEAHSDSFWLTSPVTLLPDPVRKEIAARVKLWRGFWLDPDVDAVTVSANEALQGGGGQDYVIHYHAGPSLAMETATFPDDGVTYYGGFRVRCPTGHAVISHGHNLKQPYIVHLVAPYLDEKGKVQVGLYMQTLRSALACIDGMKIRSLSLAVFGTGFYGCPKLLANVMTLRVICDWLAKAENRAKCDMIYVTPDLDERTNSIALLWEKVFGTIN